MLPLHCKIFIRIYNIHIINVRFLMIKGYFIEIQFSNNHINDTPHQCFDINEGCQWRIFVVYNHS